MRRQTAAGSLEVRACCVPTHAVMTLGAASPSVMRPVRGTTRWRPLSAVRGGASWMRPKNGGSRLRHPRPARRTGEGEEASMKELIKQYLDHGMSRRQLMTGLSALGMSTAAVKSVAQSLETFGQGAPPASAMRTLKGTGGALFVQQLKAAGVDHIFFNPSTGDYPIFDALVDEPAIHLIKGIHEGAVVAMADGYARASGKTGVVIVANIGLPNAMTQMVNSWKDQIPILVAVASVE